MPLLRPISRNPHVNLNSVRHAAPTDPSKGPIDFLNKYLDGGHQQYNSYLKSATHGEGVGLAINGSRQNGERIAAEIDAANSGLMAQKAVGDMVYQPRELLRGMRLKPAEYEAFMGQHKPGAVVEYPTFTSATNNLEEINLERQGDDIPVLLQMQNPRSARDVTDGFDTQYLYPPNSRFSVVSSEPMGDATRIVLQETTDPTRMQARVDSLMGRFKNKPMIQMKESPFPELSAFSPQPVPAPQVQETRTPDPARSWQDSVPLSPLNIMMGGATIFGGGSLIAGMKAAQAAREEEQMREQAMNAPYSQGQLF